MSVLHNSQPPRYLDVLPDHQTTLTCREIMTKSSDSIYNEVFVSYSRKNGVFAQKIVQAIYDSGRENVWIDWEDIEYAEDWWQKIQAGIDSADNFIFILTPESAQSKVCYDEVDYAVKSGKRIIPVEHIAVTEQSDFEQMHPNVSSHNWLPFKEEDDFDEGMKLLVKTLETDLKHVKLHTRFLVRARDWEIGDRDPSFLLTGAEIDSAETWLTEADSQKKIPEATALHRDYIIAGRERDLADKKRLRNLRWTGIVAGVIAVLAIIATVVATYSAFNAQQDGLIARTQNAIAVENQMSASTQIAELENIAPGATMGAIWNEWVNELDDITFRDYLQERLPVWRPDEINGVSMVRVPAGCFNMGSDDGTSNEQPVHEVCFEEDFWIDQYEVTNKQFESFGGEASELPEWVDPMQPRTQVTWFEAQNFCALREASLLTEAQWEYAARGVNSWTYPWGNDFIEDNVTYSVNSNGEPSIVGSRLRGVSWVGAYDMSGNVWEWTSSLYSDYPYDAGDGRENLDDETAIRVLRGGFFTNIPIHLYSALRASDVASLGSDNVGFRCVVPVQ